MLLKYEITDIDSVENFMVSVLLLQMKVSQKNEVIILERVLRKKQLLICIRTLICIKHNLTITDVYIIMEQC